jgi:tRNA(fMet)-specific endonuclease VapC
MAFDRFCLRTAILPFNEEAAVKASEIYADLSIRGELIGDADILIAASSLVKGLGVATNNESHFRRIPNLLVENWLK